MGLFKKKEKKDRTPALAQLRRQTGWRFGALEGYVPLGQGEVRLYRTIREAVPVVDAAIYKIIRLVGGVSVRCGDREAQRRLEQFLARVPVGRGQIGINAFLDCYLDSMLTAGQAVGEMVVRDGELAAVLCGRVEDVQLQEGASPLEFTVCGWDETGALRPLPRQELLLFTPFDPEAEHPYGVSLLRSMPFLAELLSKIYHAMGANWERMGNVRFAVVYKPQSGESGLAQERSEQIAQAWSRAMEQTRSGEVRDFVAVGDVEIRVIGADNQVLDSEVPVRQILEQLVSRTGIPPFMLGLSWSSTERMSAQQADILTSELTAIRRTLTPVVERICELWLRLEGYGCGFQVVWDDINLQDCLEEAKAEWYVQQARRLRLENDELEKGEKDGDQKDGRSADGGERPGGGHGPHQPAEPADAGTGGGVYLRGAAV